MDDVWIGVWGAIKPTATDSASAREAGSVMIALQGVQSGDDDFDVHCLRLRWAQDYHILDRVRAVFWHFDANFPQLVLAFNNPSTLLLVPSPPKRKPFSLYIV